MFNDKIKEKNLDLPLIETWPTIVLVEDDLTADELVAIRQNLAELPGRPDTHFEKLMVSLEQPGLVTIDKYYLYFVKSEKPNPSYLSTFNR
jgi:hypothetical protein